MCRENCPVSHALLSGKGGVLSGPARSNCHQALCRGHKTVKMSHRLFHTGFLIMRPIGASLAWNSYSRGDLSFGTWGASQLPSYNLDPAGLYTEGRNRGAVRSNLGTAQSTSQSEAFLGAIKLRFTQRTVKDG